MQTACTTASEVFGTLCFGHNWSKMLPDFKNCILNLPNRELKVRPPVLQLLSLIISGVSLIHSCPALTRLVNHGSRKLGVAWEKHLAAGAGFEGGGCQIRSQLLKDLACFVCVSENSAAGS